MDTNSFSGYRKADDLYNDIDDETRFDTSIYDLDRLWHEGKNKKVIELMRDELSGKIMTKFVRLREKHIVT